MHPFSLTEEETKLVSGGVAVNAQASNPVLEASAAIAQKAAPGWATTLAIGEEGGLPPDWLA